MVANRQKSEKHKKELKQYTKQVLFQLETIAFRKVARIIIYFILIVHLRFQFFLYSLFFSFSNQFLYLATIFNFVFDIKIRYDAVTLKCLG